MELSISQNVTALQLTEGLEHKHGGRTAKQAAKEILQKVIDELSEAVMAGDEEILANRVSFPCGVTTQNKVFTIETREDWLETLLAFGRGLHNLGVNHFIRLVSDADFLSENYIEGHHVTHSMCNATSVVPSYANRTILSRIDGDWRIIEINTSLQNNRWPLSMPKVDAASIPNWDRPAHEDDIRRTSMSPMSLYQDYLNELSRCNLEDDFDGWCGLCAFPHTVHIDTIDEVIERPEQIRPFFDMIRNNIEKHNIDRFDRHAERAEFISASQICGYHTGNLSSKGDLKIGPVASRYILQRTGTTWRAVSITNSVKNNQFPYSVPELSEALVSLRDIQERTTRQ